MDKPFELVQIDTKSNPADAVAALQTTVADQSFVALIGFYHSSTALASKPIIHEARIPTLIYSASNPAVTDVAPYYYRLVPTDDSQAVVWMVKASTHRYPTSGEHDPRMPVMKV